MYINCMLWRVFSFYCLDGVWQSKDDDRQNLHGDDCVINIFLQHSIVRDLWYLTEYTKQYRNRQISLFCWYLPFSIWLGHANLKFRCRRSFSWYPLDIVRKNVNIIVEFVIFIVVSMVDRKSTLFRTLHSTRCIDLRFFLWVLNYQKIYKN